MCALDPVEEEAYKDTRGKKPQYGGAGCGDVGRKTALLGELPAGPLKMERAQ